MEPVVRPLHSSSPPPPQGDEEEGEADGGMRSEDDEFGAFSSGLSSDPSGLNPAIMKAAVEQSQPASTVNFDSSRDQEVAKRPERGSALHLTNGHAGGELICAARPEEESGFADFTVFTEPSLHPWCCGFSPGGAAEQWDSRAKAGNDQTCQSGDQVVMKLEPRSHSKAGENTGTKVEHCECRDEGASSQHHLQPEDGDRDSVFSVPLVLDLKESISEDLPSFSDDLSFEGASAAEMEPNVSSLVSPDGSTDWDRTDDEEEDLEDYALSPSESHFNRNATQESSATSRTKAEDRFAEVTDGSLDVINLGNLPPSDSFADFCSAPTQENATSAAWAEFKEQSADVEGKTWTEFTERNDGNADGQDGEGIGCQASLSCRVQQLLQVSFPEVLVSELGKKEEEEEEETLSLSAVLQSQQLPEEEEEEEEEEKEKEKEATPKLSGAQRIQQEMLRPLQDVHSAVGLRFQWGGSHVHGTLLRCLGVDARNIVFMGTKKQPVTLPAFASGLGLLEPTKDSTPAVCTSKHPVVTTGVPPGPRDLSSRSMQQEALPSGQLDWSRSGLSSSQDGTSPRRAPHFWGRK